MMHNEPEFPKLDEFHKHLDECKQCEENPFEKCAVGQVLIKKAAVEVEETILPDWTHRAFDGA
jgi:hypothetical protein